MDLADYYAMALGKRLNDSQKPVLRALAVAASQDSISHVRYDWVYKTLREPPFKSEAFDQERGQELLAHMRRKGYRALELILTPEEHWLNYSSPADPNTLQSIAIDDDGTTPYTPTGIITNVLTIEEAARARSLERYFETRGMRWQGHEDVDSIVNVSLAPLNSRGMTAFPPQLLDERLESIPDSRYSQELPYQPRAS